MRLPVTGTLNNATWELLLNSCQPCFSGEDLILELDLSSATWSPPSGLVPLTSLINLLKSKGVNVSVVQYPAPTVCSYYCRMDFFSQIGVDSPCLSQRRNSLGRFIEITELAGPQISQEKREQLSLLLENAVDANQHSKSSFIDACGELVSNIRHAYNVSVDPNVFSHPRAYIGPQYYPNKSEIEFCICDSGVGIKASLEATDTNGIRSDLEAIDIALARG